jgi:aspartyl/asparaginyl beta-hydroxylase (cupin superfamily)
MAQPTPDATAALAAADAALLAQPDNLKALLVRAVALAELGRLGEAVAAYRVAASVAGRMGKVPADLQALLQRAAAIPGEVPQAFEKAAMARFSASGPPSPRIQEALNIQLGKARIYVQEPLKFYFPGLPQIAFYERDDFSWSVDLESKTSLIRQELDGVLQRQNAFAPYVDLPGPGKRDSSGMAGNADWSACFLIKNGEPNPALMEACPSTMAALAGLPLAAMPNRGPSILFSALKPGARIPPHHGFVNTRLICHLPLIAPEGCALRVGSHIRPWREGELLIFDDSFEHEAWNHSDRLRVVLLFDVWRPELTLAERAQVNAIFDAVDETRGAPPAWES